MIAQRTRERSRANRAYISLNSSVRQRIMFDGEEFVKALFAVAAFFPLIQFFFTASGFAATAELKKTEPASQGGGLIFETSHDVILSRARAEGKLRVLSSFSPEAFRRMRELMQKKYSFLDISVEEITGPDAQQRLLLELKAGTAKDWDVVAATPDMYNEFVPERKTFDILGMAQQGVLAINPQDGGPGKSRRCGSRQQPLFYSLQQEAHLS